MVANDDDHDDHHDDDLDDDHDDDPESSIEHLHPFFLMLAVGTVR